MTSVHKTSLLIALVVIAVLAVGFFLVTNTFVNSAPEHYVPEVQMQTNKIESDALFYVAVADSLVLELDTISAEDAQTRCEAIAFDTNNMWQQVVCVYDGIEIYNDVFVAG